MNVPLALPRYIHNVVPFPQYVSRRDTDKLNTGIQDFLKRHSSMTYVPAILNIYKIYYVGQLVQMTEDQVRTYLSTPVMPESQIERYMNRLKLCLQTQDLDFGMILPFHGEMKGSGTLQPHFFAKSRPAGMNLLGGAPVVDPETVQAYFFPSF